MNRIQGAFDEIRADDALLEQTAAYLQKQRTGKKAHPRFSCYIRPMAAMAAMLVLVIGIFVYQFYFTAGAYVSIDVNPSVELTLNSMDRVIGTYAFNDDGEQILREVNLSGKKYDEAVMLLIAAMNDRGYLTDEALVSVTVQTANSDKEQALSESLLQSVKTVSNTAKIEVFSVSSQVWEEAHGFHMSPAKYLAIQELLEIDDTATLEQYGDANIRQIRQRTQQCREEHAGTGRGSGHGDASNAGNDHGNNQSGGHGHGYQGGR